MFIFIIGKQITGGSFNVTAKWLIENSASSVIIAKETLNFCDFLTEIHHTCPVDPGEYVFKYHDTIPAVFPKVIFLLPIMLSTLNALLIIP